MLESRLQQPARILPGSFFRIPHLNEPAAGAATTLCTPTTSEQDASVLQHSCRGTFKVVPRLSRPPPSAASNAPDFGLRPDFIRGQIRERFVLRFTANNQNPIAIGKQDGRVVRSVESRAWSEALGAAESC
jgi:hypothetical protein